MTSQSPFDPDLVRELASLIIGTDLTEIEVEKGDLRIRVARIVTHAAPVSVVSAAPAPVLQEVSAAIPSLTSAAPSMPPAGTVTSPMVGTAYLSASPQSKPFVEVGSKVTVGEKLLLIEAMKTFNDIVAPRSGVVTSILIGDKQPVEFGEPLLVIE